MPRRIFVTGYGMISCMGPDVPPNFSALLENRPGIGPLQRIDTVLKNDFPVGEVHFTNEQLFGMAGLVQTDGFSRNALLGLIAAREAAVHARLDQFSGLSTGLISATTVGGMDQCEFFYEDFLQNDTKNAFIESYDCADSTERIAEALGITGFISTISTACSSAANAIMLGARMIRSGKLDRALTGGCESLTRFHLNGFNALKILDKEPYKPLDRDRAGINLGEGAAYLVLESEESLAMTGNVPIAEIVGWGNSCEAFHQTASSPDGIGPFLAMQKALEMSGLNANDTDYINAHGTGTDNNDISEGRAVERLFGTSIPRISSTKQFTGHTTSAAGSTEAIISLFCLQYNIIWPNLNFRNRIEELSFVPVSAQEHRKVKAVMSNSFGFGGNDTSLIFVQPEL